MLQQKRKGMGYEKGPSIRSGLDWMREYWVQTNWVVIDIIAFRYPPTKGSFNDVYLPLDSFGHVIVNGFD